MNQARPRSRSKNPPSVWVCGAAGVLIVVVTRWVLALLDSRLRAEHRTVLFDGPVRLPPEVESDYKDWLWHHHRLEMGFEIALIFLGIFGLGLLNRSIEKSILKESTGTRMIVTLLGAAFLFSATFG